MVKFRLQDFGNYKQLHATNDVKSKEENSTSDILMYDQQIVSSISTIIILPDILFLQID